MTDRAARGFTPSYDRSPLELFSLILWVAGLDSVPARPRFSVKEDPSGDQPGYSQARRDTGQWIVFACETTYIASPPMSFPFIPTYFVTASLHIVLI